MIFILFLAMIIALQSVATIKTAGYLSKKSNCETGSPIIQASSYLKDDTNQKITIISNAWVYFGFYNNMKAYSIYQNNLSEEIETVNANYVIYTNSAISLRTPDMIINSLIWQTVFRS